MVSDSRYIMSVAALSHYNATALWLQQAPGIRPVSQQVAPTLDVPECLTRRSKRRKCTQQHAQRSPGLLDLPEELTLAIAELVDAADLAFLSMTCRSLRLGTVRIISLQHYSPMALHRAQLVWVQLCWRVRLRELFRKQVCPWHRS